MEEEEFIKLNKKQKLEITPVEEYSIKGITRALFIPLNTKNDGYRMCAFFVCSKGKWFRMMDYDCFRFLNAGQKLKGDFENGGVQFFLEEGWSYDYGGEFKKD